MGCKRCDRRIKRCALVDPNNSAWKKLFTSGCDQSLITFTGLDYKAFQILLRLFEPVYWRFTPYSKSGFIKIKKIHYGGPGRPRSMDAATCLVLSLSWTRTRGSTMVLCMLFGITSSVCSLFLRFGRRILMQILSNSLDAKVQLPTDNEIKQYCLAIKNQYSSLENVWVVADGLKIYLEQAGDCIIQNMFYNGWTHDHYIGNVLVFAPSGLICIAAINAPGSMHDSMIAEWGGIYEKLSQVFDRSGAYCVVDSAFSRSNHPFLIKSSQDLPLTNGAQEVIKVVQATSARQAAEWGMRAFQSSFLHIKDHLIYEEGGE